MSEYQFLYLLFVVSVLIALFCYLRGVSGRGKQTVENTPIGLDDITLVLNDLKQRGFSLPHVVIFADKSGRVDRDYVGKKHNLLFHFDHVDEIASEYVRWQADWRME